MKRAPSALVSIGGFGVAVAMLSIATTATIIVVAPPPPTFRMSAADAIEALRAPPPGFERDIISRPPPGERLKNLENSIAAKLQRPRASVVVTRLDEAASGGVRNRQSAATDNAAPHGQTMIFRSTGDGLFEKLDPNVQSQEYLNAEINMMRPAFAVSIRQPDGRWLRVEPSQPLLSPWQRNMLISLALTLLLLVPLAWIFARRLTRPFRALAGALGDNADAVPQEGPRELREAAAAIDAMRTRLAIEAAERARILTAIAHDLRTPMTGLRLRTESAPEPQRTRMIADIERMQAMIGEVLNFARDAAAPVEIVDVQPLLADIVQEMDARGRKTRLLDGDDAQIAVSKPTFRRAIENLLQNASDYAGGGSVRAKRTAHEVEIIVSDKGPGIPADDRERLLRPFERGDASRNRETGGVGLGLSIVRDFAARNHGSFELCDAPERGTLAVLRLPIA